MLGLEYYWDKKSFDRFISKSGHKFIKKTLVLQWEIDNFRKRLVRNMWLAY
jgi:hypothetical protein